MQTTDLDLDVTIGVLLVFDVQAREFELFYS